MSVWSVQMRIRQGRVIILRWTENFEAISVFGKIVEGAGPRKLLRSVHVILGLYLTATSSKFVNKRCQRTSYNTH